MSNTMTDNKKPPLWTEKFMIMESIDEFRKFQNDMIEGIKTKKKVCLVAPSGKGKTTIIKYLSFDIFDKYKNDRALILVNTRPLGLDIEKSMASVFGARESRMICNLTRFNKDNPITTNDIIDARIIISTPEKYLRLSKKLGVDFRLLCIDEIDTFFEDTSIYSNNEIIDVMNKVNFEYLFTSTATLSDSVENNFIKKYNLHVYETSATTTIVNEYKVGFNRSTKMWLNDVLELIDLIIQLNPMNKKSIVFSNYRNECNMLYNMCHIKGKYHATGEHSTEELDTILHEYTQFGVILFTTDMSQRGLNIDSIENVFHIGLTSRKNYIHRNGRSLRKIDSVSNSFILYDINSTDNELLNDENIKEYTEIQRYR